MGLFTKTHGKLKVFGLSSHTELAQEVASYLGIKLGKIKTSTFSCGENYVRIKENVRGDHVYIIQTATQDVNNTFMELLIAIDAFKKASAKSINVIIPHYPYSRQDKKSESREPITARLVANLLETAGVNRVITMDLHADQIQGFFNVPVDHLMGLPLFANYFDNKFDNKENLVIVAPDTGRAKAAKKFADKIGAELAIIHKNRQKHNESEVVHLIGDVKGKSVVIYDDIVDTGGSVVNARKALEANGATEFYLNKPIDTLDLQIIKTDTIKSSFYFYGALLENSKPSIKYTGIGINGASTSSYLKAEYLDYHLKAINPDLVIFSIGVNDAASKSFSKQVYISNYKKLADKILEVNPYCAIIFTTNNDFYYYRGGVNPHYKAVYYAMTSLAKKYNASVWNMFNVMGGYKSINFWKNDKIARRDRIHFTRAGYKILADLLFDAIMKDYEEFLIKK